MLHSMLYFPSWVFDIKSSENSCSQYDCFFCLNPECPKFWNSLLIGTLQGHQTLLIFCCLSGYSFSVFYWFLLFWPPNLKCPRNQSLFLFSSVSIHSHLVISYSQMILNNIWCLQLSNLYFQSKSCSWTLNPNNEFLQISFFQKETKVLLFLIKAILCVVFPCTWNKFHSSSAPAKNLKVILYSSLSYPTFNPQETSWAQPSKYIQKANTSYHFPSSSLLKLSSSITWLTVVISLSHPYSP